jgi:hypothetical protein
MGRLKRIIRIRFENTIKNGETKQIMGFWVWYVLRIYGSIIFRIHIVEFTCRLHERKTIDFAS